MEEFQGGTVEAAFVARKVGADNTRIADYVVPGIAFHAPFDKSSRKMPEPEGTESALTTHFVLRRSTDFPPEEVKREARSKSKPSDAE